jgi:hypothetical protein
MDTQQKLIEGMVYFLNMLTFDINDNKERKDGYKHLSNQKLEEIIGQKRPTIIRKILQENGIIEILPHINHKQSTGYRLTQKYCKGEFEYIEYSNRIKHKIKQFQNSVENEDNHNLVFDNCVDDVSHYPYLGEQFQKNNLKVRTHHSDQTLRDLLFPLYPPQQLRLTPLVFYR